MDLERLLNGRGIAIAGVNHKHYRDGWTHVNCPFCGDGGFHLGFPNGSNSGRCFKCGKHWLSEYLQDELRINQFEARKLIAELSGRPMPKQREAKQRSVCSLPNGCVGIDLFSRRHKDYLSGRNYEAEALAKEWGIMAIGSGGSYPWSIVIPVIHDGAMVSWQSRDITDKRESKYVTCPGTEVKDFLYGLDSIEEGKPVIVVEGVPSVWRLGKGIAIATFGQDWTNAQLVELIRKKPDSVLVLFDSEPKAQQKGNELAGALSSIGFTAESHDLKDFAPPEWKFSGKDPGELSQEAANDLVTGFLDS